MLYKVLADVVVFIHFLWIVFLIFGAVLGRKKKTVGILHISGIVFALVIQIFGWYCPLTYLEVWLRAKHNPVLAYPGSFIAHYAEEIVYLELSRGLIFVLTVIIGGFNAWLYLKGRKR
jgi:hypothetical protein